MSLKYYFNVHFALRVRLGGAFVLRLGLAFGRVLVNQPRLVILDEATSALDMVAESKMYQLLRNMGQKQLLKNGKMSAPGLTYVSVGHRPSLLAYHDMRLRLGGEEQQNVLEAIEKSSINAQSFNVSNL